MLMIALLLCCAVSAAQDVQILGLGKNKVVINIAGETKVLSVGESAGGIKVISADTEQCVLEINGQSSTYPMGSQVSTNFAKTTKPIVRIVQDNSGLYRSSGLINGQMVNVIVDTGATMVTMNANQAKSLGLDKKGQPIQVVTASGKTKGYLVNLDQVSLGAIQAYNVQGVIVEGAYPPQILLGMSFLQGLEINHRSQLLELQQKY
jgi:aspartyl protease family protein